MKYRREDSQFSVFMNDRTNGETINFCISHSLKKGRKMGQMRSDRGSINHHTKDTHLQPMKGKSWSHRNRKFTTKIRKTQKAHRKL